MKTIIEYKDGRQVEHEGLAPTVETEQFTISLMDADCGVHESDIPWDDVKRVVFEPEVES